MIHQYVVMPEMLIVLVSSFFCESQIVCFMCVRAVKMRNFEVSLIVLSRVPPNVMVAIDFCFCDKFIYISLSNWGVNRT